MDDLISDIENEAKKEGWLLQATRVILSGLNALILSAFAILFDNRAALSAKDGTLGPVGFWLVVLLLIALFLAISAFILYKVPNALTVYFKAREIERKHTALERDSNRYEQQITYFSLFAEACNQWQILQTVLKTQTKPTPQELAEIFFALIIRAREDLFGFEVKEHWNFALYIYDDSEKLLKPVWRKMSSRHPAGKNKQAGEIGRSWKPGVGHTGKAFFDNKTIITKDGTHEEVQALMSLPTGSQAREYDDWAYKSYASIPISLDEQTEEESKVIGVILATSNVAGRFDLANCLILKQLAKVLYGVLA